MLNKETYEFRVIPAPRDAFVTPPDGEDPPPPPPHRVTIWMNDGIPVGYYENEHGRQALGHLVVGKEWIRWTVLSGTPGDELFFYKVKIEDGKIKGWAYREGLPYSDLEGVRIS